MLQGEFGLQTCCEAPKQYLLLARWAREGQRREDLAEVSSRCNLNLFFHALFSCQSASRCFTNLRPPSSLPHWAPLQQLTTLSKESFSSSSTHLRTPPPLAPLSNSLPSLKRAVRHPTTNERANKPTDQASFPNNQGSRKETQLARRDVRST